MARKVGKPLRRFHNVGPPKKPQEPPGLASRFSLGTLRESFSTTPRSLRLAWQSSAALCGGITLLTFVAAALPLAIAYVGKSIVDAVVAHESALALRQVGFELALIAAQALVLRSVGLSRQILGARLGLDINVRILEKALTLELAHFEDPVFYDQLSRARREASSRPVAVVTDTFQIAQNVLTLGGYVALLLNYNAWAVAGLFLAALPATFAEMHFSTAAFRLRNWRAPETRMLGYVEHVLANDAHAKEVKIFGLGPHLLSRYRELGNKLTREDTSLAVKRTAWATGLSLVATGAFYACYAAMALAAATGRLTLGDLTLYVVAFRQGQQAFQSSLSAIGGMYENNLYMTNLFSYLAIPTRAPLEARLPEMPGIGDSVRGIRFEHVGFRYPGQERWALEDVDLFIPEGQSLALVGHNGAGKTTFIKLLARLYEPTRGRILLDGQDLRSWDELALRSRLAVVFQDFARYQFTFRDNVSFGSITHAREDTRLARAVERGGASDVLTQLPEGYDTALGRWFHEGTELSGGQWQKVALARAFMREEADILVLDEPTAALDAEAEYAIFERFRTLTKGRTTILISHRFPTVRMADAIAVIEGGRIQEFGTHAELLAKDGRYAQLFALQARGYL